MKRIFICLSLLVLLSAPLLAHASSVQTLGPYSGLTSYNDPGPYQPLTTVGTFTITPGDTAITISGFFGNDIASSSAGENLYLGSLLVAQCVEFTACYNGGPTAWSDTLTPAQIASLGTGIINFNVLQTSQYVIRLGTTTLTQTTATAVTPEPSTFVLLGTGLIGVVGAARRKFSV